MSLIPEDVGSELSVDSAAALMGKALDAEARAPEPEKDEGAKVIDMLTKKPAEPAKPAETKAADEDDEDLEFELPGGEEGKEAKRLKLSELYQGYEKAAKLEAELTEVKTKAETFPAELQSLLSDTVAQRSQYIERLDVLAKTIQPQRPHPLLIDPQSEYYNPDAYAAQMQEFERKSQLLASIEKDRAKQTKLQDEQQDVLNKAALAREFAEMDKHWPEFRRDPKIRTQVAETLKGYGFTPEEIEGIRDNRHVRIVKDVLKLRELEAKQAEAVKTVRSTPKLVKGAARSTTNPHESARSNAMQTLRKTGSMDAAAAALKGLI